jgi:hypothetical protein
VVRHGRSETLNPSHVPDWIVEGLELWLEDFLALASIPKHKPKLTRPARFQLWAREYLHALKDWMIADHLEANRRVYGMTRAEALDEASCYFRGTRLAGSVTASRLLSESVPETSGCEGGRARAIRDHGPHYGAR